MELRINRVRINRDRPVEQDLNVKLGGFDVKSGVHCISWMVLTNERNLLVEALSATYEAENPSFPTLASETNLICITFSVEVRTGGATVLQYLQINVRKFDVVM